MIGKPTAMDETVMTVIRENYKLEIKNLIDEKKYGDAFDFLLKHRDVKKYLSRTQLRTMYNFLESTCFDIGIIANELSDKPSINLSRILERLKELDGRKE
ncbi:hypothetical protein M0R19_02930 [Candidatus Pacearchaeota archaeon]|jgi:hypothetical protein|nr:hypothetical protein [Candidatus Pacearchaeota archaeon]